jgi:uncharacterized cofD-like protein
VQGGTVTGQVAVAQSSRPIYEAYLDPPDPPAHPGAVQAILDADQIVLGPGSLFTSLIATLLVPQIRDALIEATAFKVFVCNNRIQKGETEGFTAAAHIGALASHINSARLDAIVLQSPVLEADGVLNDLSGLPDDGPRVVEADVSDRGGGHEAAKLARVLESLR